jgi:hypothetical protein
MPTQVAAITPAITPLDVKDLLGPDCKLYLALRPGQEELLHIPENPYLTTIDLLKLEELESLGAEYRFVAMTEPVPYLRSEFKRTARMDPSRFGLFAFADNRGFQEFLNEINGGPVMPKERAQRDWSHILVIQSPPPTKKKVARMPPPLLARQPEAIVVKGVDETAVAGAELDESDSIITPADITPAPSTGQILEQGGGEEDPPSDEDLSGLSPDQLAAALNLGQTEITETDDGSDNIDEPADKEPNPDATEGAAPMAQKNGKPSIKDGVEAYLTSAKRTADQITGEDYPAMAELVEELCGKTPQKNYLYNIVSGMRKGGGASSKKAAKKAGRKPAAGGTKGGSSRKTSKKRATATKGGDKSAGNHASGPSSNGSSAKALRLLQYAELGELCEDPQVSKFLELLWELDPSRATELEIPLNQASEIAKLLKTV